jgi:multiple sugar transport system substrate-binding protein
MISIRHRATRRAFAAGATAAALLGTVAACGDDGPAGTADDPVTISFEWWGNEDRADITQQAIDLFEEKNEGIKVRTNFSDFPTHWESMTTRMASRDLPDVFQMDYSRLRQFGGNGMLLPLDGLIDTSDFRDGFIETGYVDDELVAVPVAGNTLGLLYRADWFDEAGVDAPQAGYSWDDYHADMATLTDELGDDVWGGGDYAGQYHFMELWLRQQGGSFYTEDGTSLNFTEADLVQWWTQTAGLHEDGAIVPVSVGAELDEDPILLDMSGSGISWDNFLPWWAPTVAENGGDLQLAAPPTRNASNLGLYQKPSMQFVIAANTDHAEASAKLIEFLLTDPEAIAILGTNRGIPATNTGLANVELDAVSQAVLDYEESVADYLSEPPAAPPAATGAIEQKFAEIYEQVVYDQMTADDAAALFFTEAGTLLDAEQ